MSTTPNEMSSTVEASAGGVRRELRGGPANRMDGNQLGHVVRAKTAQGEPHAEGVVVSYADRPTFTIETASGREMTWRAHLCEAMDGWEQAAYWQERARIAESKLAEAPGPE